MTSRTSYSKSELKRFHALGKFPSVKTPTEIVSQLRYVREKSELIKIKTQIQTDIEILILHENHKASESTRLEYMEKMRFSLK